MSLLFAPLYSGSGGNCTYIANDDTAVLVDAGLTGKCILSAMDELGLPKSKIRAILITHEHLDHVKGVGVLSRKLDVPVYANAATWAAMETKMGSISPKNKVITDTDDFFVEELLISPVAISHDAAQPTGYTVSSGGKKAAILTDTGKITVEMLQKVVGSSVIILEANHDIEMLRCGPYPYKLKQRILSQKGHLSNDDSAAFAVMLAKLGIKGILLGHLSKENNFPELAYNTVAAEIIAAGYTPGDNIALGVLSEECKKVIRL